MPVDAAGNPYTVDANGTMHPVSQSQPATPQPPAWLTPQVQPTQAAQSMTQTPGSFQFDPSRNPTDPAYVRQFVDYLATLPNADPQLKNDPNYYVQQIIANGGGVTQDNANYWQSHVTNPANYTPGGGGGTLSTMGRGTGFSFDPTQVANDPGYKFALQQGLNAIQGSAAARGTLLGTGTLKDLSGFAAGQAYQGENQLFNQNLAGFQTNFNNLGTIANMGYGATQQAGNYTTGAAAAGAAGTVGATNAVNSGVNGVGNAYQNANLYRQFNPSGGS